MEDNKKNKVNLFPFEFYAVCVDDSRPDFNVNMWIRKGAIYKTSIDSMVKNVIDNDTAFAWEDKYGNPIIPNERLNCQHIKMKRFKPLYENVLNGLN